MKRLLSMRCLIVLALFAGSIAKADDLKGPYVGVTVGDAIGRSDVRTTTVFSSTGYFAATSVTAIGTSGALRITPTGFTASGLIGYNFLQHGNIILGGEADFSALIASSVKAVTTTYPCCAGTAFTISQQVSANWLLTARPRVGYMWGNVLLYGTGGLAVTHVAYHELFSDTFASAQENAVVRKDMIGWAAGGGAEYKIGSHWSVKAEYLYAAFGRTATTSTNLTAAVAPGSFPSNVFTHSTDLHMSIARAGLNWRF